MVLKIGIWKIMMNKLNRLRSVYIVYTFSEEERRKNCILFRIQCSYNTFFNKVYTLVYILFFYIILYYIITLFYYYYYVILSFIEMAFFNVLNFDLEVHSFLIDFRTDLKGVIFHVYNFVYFQMYTFLYTYFQGFLVKIGI